MQSKTGANQVMCIIIIGSL